jgi:putative phosphoribosyl transferase
VGFSRLQRSDQPLKPVAFVADQVEIEVGGEPLYGILEIPEQCRGVVLFAHGSGSGRHSPRNRMVAEHLQSAQLGTFLFDLLTIAEERIDQVTAQFRFDIEFLGARLVAVTEWLVESHPEAERLAYFGSSTGAAAALIAAADSNHPIAAVVSRGGRPDLASRALADVRSPTLLIVGGRDPQVLELNEQALAMLECEKQLVVVPGATHLFEEPGTLQQVAEHARRWLVEHFDETGASLRKPSLCT